MKAISQGTNLSPAHWNIYKNTDKKGAPRASAIPHPFNKSMTNN